jgi:secreted Zn-dependent insulinase-like peptidase
MAPFVGIITQALKTYQPDKATFERYKDLLSREFLSWRTQQPYYHCSHYAALATETLQFKIPDTLAALGKVKDASSLKDFLVSTIPESHGTAMIVGNVDAAGAEHLVDIVEQTFAWKPLEAARRSRRRLVAIPPSPRTVQSTDESSSDSRSVSATGSASASTSTSASASARASGSDSSAASGFIVAHEEPNKEDDNSAVTFYFQMPSREVADTVLVELLAESIDQSFYNSLRTQQQLGYIVYSGVRSREGVYSLTLTVQSAVADGAELSRRVEAFIENTVGAIGDISDEDLESYKEGLAVRKLEPDQRLTDQAGRFWTEIMESINRGGGDPSTVSPLFDRYALEVAAIRRVDKGQFVSFVREFFGPGGAKRHLLVSQITSQKPPGVPLATPTTTEVLSVPVVLQAVADELAFRKSQTLL